VKSSKQLSSSSENASDLGPDVPTPVKQTKQLKVFQRKEVPLSKSTKSWVAEWVSWNDGRGCDVALEGLLGKNHTVSLDFEDLSVNIFSVLGEHEESGLLGGMVNQGKENPGVEGTLPQFEAGNLSEEQLVQGTGPVSPASKEVKFVWDVKGIAGLSCGGQEGKLKEVLGQLVAKKYGKGASSLAGVDTDGNMRLRDDGIFYEA
jgi:hypothetical protein